MSKFENGWICTQCWQANREQDLRCYRCRASSPLEEQLLALEAEKGPGPPPVHVRWLRAGAASLVKARAALARAVATAAAGVHGVALKARAALARAVAMAASGVYGVALKARAALARAVSMGASAVRAGLRKTSVSARRGAAFGARTAAGASARILRAVQWAPRAVSQIGSHGIAVVQRYVAAVQADARRAVRSVRRLVPARR